MQATLFSIPPSHPALAAKLMLRHVGLDHRVVELPPGLHPPVLRARGFPRGTVPAMILDGRKIQGTTAISRALDELFPGKLFPTDADARARVEEAEAWGEREFQPVPRRIFRWVLARDADARAALARESKMPLANLQARATAPLARRFAALVGATDERVRQDLEQLPEMLDRVDRYIAEGVIGGETPNAADFQIATTVHALMRFPQLRPMIDERPAAELARRVVGEPAQAPVRVPEEWLPAGAAK